MGLSNRGDVKIQAVQVDARIETRMDLLLCQAANLFVFNTTKNVVSTNTQTLCQYWYI